MKPAPEHRRIVVAAAAAALVLLAFVLVGLDRGEPRRAPLTPTSTRADLSEVVLQAVGGTTTTTRPRNAGRVSLSGTVRTPEGELVPGATVRAEWWRVDPPQVIEVLTDGQGQWEIEGVAGGRWKVRAYRTPDYATGKVEQLFLDRDDQRRVDLEVREVEEVSVTWDLEPDPPITGFNTNLVVVFSRRAVDGDGRTVSEPISGESVVLVADSAWQRVSGLATETTDVDGRVSWVLRCREDGPHDLSVSTFYGTKHLDVAACIPITSTSTTSTLPPPSTTEAETTTTTAAT